MAGSSASRVASQMALQTRARATASSIRDSDALAVASERGSSRTFA